MSGGGGQMVFCVQKARNCRECVNVEQRLQASICSEGAERRREEGQVAAERAE